MGSKDMVKGHIGIVNYSIGNVGSVYSALRFYGYHTHLISDPDGLRRATLIILAGVGNYVTAVTQLRKQGLWDELGRQVTTEKKPLLGICLGMQLFADVSFEGEETKGFGWIKGAVRKMHGGNMRLPHMGWNEVAPRDETLFTGMRSNAFYFMHSYHFIPEEKGVVAATTNYCGSEIVSAVRKGNIVGVQFHPEKSQGDGLRFLKNCIEVMA